MTKKQEAFSLLELLITITIVAILAAISIPAYQDYIIKANISAAQQFALRIAMQEKVYLTDTRTYTTNYETDLNLTTPDDVATLYTTTITTDNNATPPEFVISMVPIVGQMQEDSSTLTLNSVGVKSPSSLW